MTLTNSESEKLTTFDEELQFQDFSADVASQSKFEDPEKQSLKKDQSPQPWEFDYYQEFFDIDVEELLNRAKMSFLPFRYNFLDNVGDSADLYGPFWITTTLIFLIGMTGNLATYLASGDDFHYDITKLTYAATTLYSYMTFVPLFLWAFLKFYGKSEIRFLSVLSLFGYSSLIYIPIAVICIIPSEVLKWIAVIFGFVWSGYFLSSNLFPLMKELNKDPLYIVLGIVGLFHTILMLSFKFYFFEYVNN